MNLPILSHTFLSNYENCPRKAWHMYIARDLPWEEATKEMIAGREVHELADKSLKNNLPQLAPDPVTTEYILNSDGIKEYEHKMAITEAGSACNWQVDMTWFRGIADVSIVAPPNALILDWKTGKKREDPTELEGFALLLKAHYPNLEYIGGAYVWLNHGGMGALHDLSRAPEKAYRRIKNQWEGLKARPLEKEWNATPNALCGWCRVKTCEHWRAR